MDSIAVTKPDMAVTQRDRLGLSLFGLLSLAFGDEVRTRSNWQTGWYREEPLELLEEESAAPQMTGGNRELHLDVDLKVVLETLQKEQKKAGKRQEKEIAERILERVYLLERQVKETAPSQAHVTVQVDAPQTGMPRPAVPSHPAQAPQGQQSTAQTADTQKAIQQAVQTALAAASVKQQAGQTASLSAASTSTKQQAAQNIQTHQTSLRAAPPLRRDPRTMGTVEQERLGRLATPLTPITWSTASPAGNGWKPRWQEEHPGFSRLKTQDTSDVPIGSILLPDLLRRRREQAIAQAADQMEERTEWEPMQQRFTQAIADSVQRTLEAQNAQIFGELQHPAAQEEMTFRTEPVHPQSASDPAEPSEKLEPHKNVNQTASAHPAAVRDIDLPPAELQHHSEETGGTEQTGAEGAKPSQKDFRQEPQAQPVSNKSADVELNVQTASAGNKTATDDKAHQAAQQHAPQASMYEAEHNGQVTSQVPYGQEGQSSGQATQQEARVASSELVKQAIPVEAETAAMKETTLPSQELLHHVEEIGKVEQTDAESAKSSRNISQQGPQAQQTSKNANAASDVQTTSAGNKTATDDKAHQAAQQHAPQASTHETETAGQVTAQARSKQEEQLSGQTEQQKASTASGEPVKQAIPVEAGAEVMQGTILQREELLHYAEEAERVEQIGSESAKSLQKSSQQEPQAQQQTSKNANTAPDVQTASVGNKTTTDDKATQAAQQHTPQASVHEAEQAGQETAQARSKQEEQLSVQTVQQKASTASGEPVKQALPVEGGTAAMQGTILKPEELLHYSEEAGKAEQIRAESAKSSQKTSQQEPQAQQASNKSINVAPDVQQTASAGNKTATDDKATQAVLQYAPQASTHETETAGQVTAQAPSRQKSDEQSSGQATQQEAGAASSGPVKQAIPVEGGTAAMQETVLQPEELLYHIEEASKTEQTSAESAKSLQKTSQQEPQAQQASNKSINVAPDVQQTERAVNKDNKATQAARHHAPQMSMNETKQARQATSQAPSRQMGQPSGQATQQEASTASSEPVKQAIPVEDGTAAMQETILQPEELLHHVENTPETEQTGVENAAILQKTLKQALQAQQTPSHTAVKADQTGPTKLTERAGQAAHNDSQSLASALPRAQDAQPLRMEEQLVYHAEADNIPSTEQGQTPQVVQQTTAKQPLSSHSNRSVSRPREPRQAMPSRTAKIASVRPLPLPNSHMTTAQSMTPLTYAPTPQAAAEIPQNGNSELTYLPVQGQETKPEPPKPSEPAASSYISTLPDWAQRFLQQPEGNEQHTITPPKIPNAQQQIQWTAPQAMPTGTPTMVFREPKQEQTMQPPAQLSDYELRRAADKVYHMIEDRLRKEFRRSGR